MAVERIDENKLAKKLGRHARLPIDFSFTLEGAPVDLELDGYTVRVWVTAADGTTISGPKTAVVSGTVARYIMDVDDLAEASPTGSTSGNTGRAQIVAVAENGTLTLVSDSRGISIGNWGGADTYTPL